MSKNTDSTTENQTTGQTDHPMMKCGCAAQGVCSSKSGVIYDPAIPACVIHDCIEIAEHQIDFYNRRARCSYYGKRPHKNESNYGCARKDICNCEQSSDPELLAFFEYKPEKDFDQFYCGCHSWD